MKKTALFISYSRREAPFVDHLYRDLNNDSFNIWFDYRSLIPGVPWKDQINKAVDDSDVLVLVISKSSIKSKHVEAEWAKAISSKNNSRDL